MKMKLLLGFVTILLVSGSERLSEAEERVVALPKLLHHHVDPEIQKAFARNIVPNITIYPQTCTDSTDRRPGVQVIHPQPGFGEQFQAFCDQDYDGGGWTVIQNRFDGSVTFYQDWKTYEDGFGNMNGEFWLGLRKIHELTNSKRHELVVLLEHINGTTAFARYDHFLIGSPSTSYQLVRLGKFAGTSSQFNSLHFHLNAKFTTFDNDNDRHGTVNCAELFMSAWWYHLCADSDLNRTFWHESRMKWSPWTGQGNNWINRSRMMIRAVDSIFNV